MALAAALARALVAPYVMLLDGELGAGKTTFVRGFVRALPGGAGVVVQSPTFALARSYPTTPVVHHLDVYRLSDGAALDALGLHDLVHSDGFALVEWARDLVDVTHAARLTFVGVGARTITLELSDADPQRDAVLRGWNRCAPRARKA